ncbi:MAG: ATP-binding protein [Alphaproteobacteria bacterium]|jgi:signal transduction histidine kinase
MIGRHGWGTTAAFALLIVSALAFVIGCGILIASHDRELAAQHSFARAVVERTTSMAEALAALDPEERDDALEGYHERDFRVWLATELPQQPVDTWRHGDTIEEEARNAAPETMLDDLLIHALAGKPGQFDADASPAPIDRGHWRPGFYTLMVGMPVDDGGWVVAVAPARPTATRPGVTAMVRLGFVVLLVTIVALIVAHRLTRPLRDLAVAADRLSVDLDAPPLPEKGSREVRRAVTAFNAMQAQLRLVIDDRSLMLAALSHDLRTIITRLRLRAEEIDDDIQREKAFADMADMEVMLKEALDAARGEAAREERQKVDLSALLQSQVDDLTDAGETASLDGPEKLNITCRPVALRRALANLIQNAVRYGGSVEVGLSQADGMVTIDVTDRGPGIPEDQREAMFRPFMRGEPSRNRSTGGTGLGLAVARSILRAHGGEIALLERKGGGLIARATLPVAAV